MKTGGDEAWSRPPYYRSTPPAAPSSTPSSADNTSLTDAEVADHSDLEKQKRRQEECGMCGTFFGGILLAVIFGLFIWGFVKATHPGHDAHDLVGGIWPDNESAFSKSDLGFSQILVLRTSKHKNPFQREAFALAAKDADINYTLIEPFSAHLRQRDSKQTNSSVAVPPHDTPRQWYSHILALDRAANADMAVTLIIEEDVDWNVYLRVQMASITKNLLRRIEERDHRPGKPWRTAAEQVHLHESRDYFHRPRHQHTPTSNGNIVARDTLLVPVKEVMRTDVLWLARCSSQVPSIEGATDGVFNYLEPNCFHPDHMLQTSIKSDRAPARLNGEIRRAPCPLAYAVTRDGARRMLSHLLQVGPTTKLTGAMTSFCGSDGAYCSDVRPPLFRRYEGCKTTGHKRGMRYNGRRQSDDLCVEEAPSIEPDSMSARWKAAKDLVAKEKEAIDRAKDAKKLAENMKPKPENEVTFKSVKASIEDGLARTLPFKSDNEKYEEL